MESPDSIDFFAKYKDWNTAKSIEVKAGTTPKDVSAYLASVREEADGKSFQVLGIDTKALDSYAAGITKGMARKSYKEIPALYKITGASQAEQQTDKAASNREELKPFAKAYLFRASLKNLGIDFCITKESKAISGNTLAKIQKDGKAPFSSDGISFMAKYKDWISIKKLSIDDKTKPEEVSAHLASIRTATSRKSIEVLGMDMFTLDSYVSSVTENMRKSAANLEKVIAALESAEAKKEIEAACAGKDLKDAAQIYLFSSMMGAIKFDFSVNIETLMAMFPGLKIPKPKGRMPGQKKKKPA